MARTIFSTLGGPVLGLLAAVTVYIIAINVGLRSVTTAELHPGEAGEVLPSEKAAQLARAISEAMNVSSLAAVILVPLGGYGGWRRTRKRDRTE